ncbi:S-adenosyl-L-methionine-dependent methyltransferase [Cladorrhinum sp. PSN332]|nr:S-adenosyl-L-methionine-dependent methyltransferase [Cladorrhinum sp. PSN332]
MSSNAPLITRLAEEISHNTGIITECLKSHGLPQPSFDADSPSHPIPETDEKMSSARSALIEATKALNALAVGPGEAIRFFGYQEGFLLASMQVLCHFQVPQSVPLRGEISFSELSHKTGLNEAHLARFLRMVITSYYFVEPRPGFVAHTAKSKILATDNKMRRCVWFRFAELLPTAGKFIEAVEKYPDSTDPQDTAFALAFGDTFWKHKEKHPDDMLRFGQFMDAWTSGYVVDPPPSVAQAYHWETLEKGSLVVDIGGSLGHVSVAIAQEHPHLLFQIQDFEDLKTKSAALAKENGLEGRISFVPHDFFSKQPAKGAKIYFLRNILHNWSDLYCRRILKPLVEAMGPDSRIVVCDVVLPEPNTMHKTQEVLTRTMDMTMWALFNAKERSVEEWQELFASVDGRLKIEKVIGRPKLRVDCMIELKLLE